MVDDDENFRELARQRFERRGHVVELCAGAFGVLQMVRTGDYDVVVLDVNMPSLQGTKILDMIRADGTDAKVVLASSIDEAELALLAQKHGADAYIYKGASRDEMVAVIERLFE